jgi:hypothetical protein
MDNRIAIFSRTWGGCDDGSSEILMSVVITLFGRNGCIVFPYKRSELPDMKFVTNASVLLRTFCPKTGPQLN